MFEYNKISCLILIYLVYIVISNEDMMYVVVEFLKGIFIKKNKYNYCLIIVFD